MTYVFANEYFRTMFRILTGWGCQCRGIAFFRMMECEGFSSDGTSSPIYVIHQRSSLWRRLNFAEAFGFGRDM